MYAIIFKRFELLLSIASLLFGTHASAATFTGFNSGPFYSVVGTPGSPTTPITLSALFDEAVTADTTISIFSSDPAVTVATFGGVTIMASQSSATVLLDAFNIGAVTLTGVFGEIAATASVNVVSNTPSAPIPPTAWLLASGLGQYKRSCPMQSSGQAPVNVWSNRGNSAAKEPAAKLTRSGCNQGAA